MGNFKVLLDDELSKAYKQKIIERFGKLRGFINIAFEEAVRDWVNKSD